MSTNKRRAPDARREEILETAVKMGAGGLFRCITREEVAARIGIAPTLVTHYWRIDDLRSAVLAIGCERRIPRLVVEAVMVGHAAAAGLSDAVKAQAIRAVR